MTDMSRPRIEPGPPLAVSTDGERALCIPPYIDSCHLIDLLKDGVVHHVLRPGPAFSPEMFWRHISDLRQHPGLGICFVGEEHAEHVQHASRYPEKSKDAV